MRAPVLLLLLMAFSPPALAQALERDVAALRTDFEYGKYDEVLRDAQARLDRGVDEPKLLLEIHKLAGISAFNLNRPAVAERHLTAALRIDPDFTLDPFVFPPPVVEFHERIRKQLGPELQFIRQGRELEEARQRAAAAETARAEAERERRRLEAIPRRITTETIDRRSLFVNFVPFGAGQFQQGRTQLGLWLASLQGATAATSIIAFWAHEALVDTVQYDIPGTKLQTGGVWRVTLRGIPPEDAFQAQNWRLIKTISAITFYGLYAFGVIDALIQHQDSIVTTNVSEQPAAPPQLTPPPPKATLLPLLHPTPGGGFTAGFELRF